MCHLIYCHHPGVIHYSHFKRLNKHSLTQSHKLKGPQHSHSTYMGFKSHHSQEHSRHKE